MRHDFIDRYSRLDSPIHRLPAGLKLAASLGIVVLIVGVPSSRWWVFGAAGVFLLAVLLASRVPPLFALTRLLMLEPFVLGVALLSLLGPRGVETFLGVLLRSTLCLLTMLLLSNTTTFASLLAVLRRVRVPGVFLTVLALLYRYLFVLIDQAERMGRARRSRTFARGRGRRWHLLSTVLGQLFLRSFERAERIYAAMLARGWR